MRLNKLQIRDIILLWVLLYAFFAFIYWDFNPLDWKWTGGLIAILVGIKGTKNHVTGKS